MFLAQKTLPLAKLALPQWGFRLGAELRNRSTSEMTPSRGPRKRLRLRIPNLILSLTYQAHGIYPIVLLTAWGD
jgi:hypothetical protein